MQTSPDQMSRLSATTPREITRVEQSVASISAANDRLSHLVAQLEDRLSPVLQPEQTITLREQSDTPEPRPKSSHVVALDGQFARADGIADQIQGMLDRLDI